jgi:HSP20 family protein
MALPVRHRPGGVLERNLAGWGQPIVAEFDELFERMSQFLESAAATPSEPRMLAWAPFADLRETDDAYVVEVEVPGIKREDVDVEIAERELIISGQLKEREREGVLRRGTRRSGHFEYRALLPTEVKAEDVNATLADGVLTVTVPKAQAIKPRHIEVTEVTGKS